jgi:hypothetical protein
MAAGLSNFRKGPFEKKVEPALKNVPPCADEFLDNASFPAARRAYGNGSTSEVGLWPVRCSRKPSAPGRDQDPDYLNKDKSSGGINARLRLPDQGSVGRVWKQHRLRRV